MFQTQQSLRAKVFKKSETLKSQKLNGKVSFQCNFYHYHEKLVAVGCTDKVVEKFGGRREVFEMADDEQLIGCELD